MRRDVRKSCLGWALAGTSLVAMAQPVPVPRPAPPAELPAAAPLTLPLPARPALAASEGLTVPVERFTATGNTRIASADIARVLAPYTQRTLRFDELAAAADAVTALYRARGFLLALAYLPEQQIENGNVEIAVLEGRLGELAVGTLPEGIDRGFAEATAQRGIARGAVVDEGTLVRNLLLLNELPGLAASAEVKPGAQVGEADVAVALAETGPRASGVLSADNHGSRSTGRVRLGAAATVRQLAGRGDVLNLQATVGDRNALKAFSGGYSVPLNAAGTRLAVSASTLDYRVVAPAFDGLDARGDATYLQLTVDQPLLRRVGYGVTLRAGGVHKALSDRIEAFAQNEARHVDAWIVALRGEQQDRPRPGDAPFAPTGSTTWSVTGTLGRVGFDDPVAQAADAVQRATAGRYARLNIELTREQPLGERFALIGRVALQNPLKRNLDNAERSVLGGANALRPYGELATLADRSALGAIELRHRTALGGVPLATSLFFDIGHGRGDRYGTAAADPAVRARLIGVCTEAALPAAFTVRLAATRQTVTPPPTNGERWVSRGWLEVVKGF